MFLKFCNQNQITCIFEIISSTLPLIFLIVIGYKSLTKIVQERLKRYGKAPGFGLTNIFKAKLLFLLLQISGSVLGLIVYLTNVTGDIYYLTIFAVYCVQIGVNLLTGLFIRIEFNYFGFTTQYFNILTLSQILCITTFIACTFIDDPNYWNDGFYFLIFNLTLYVSLLIFCYKYPYDVPKEKIELRMAKMDLEMKK